MLNELSLRIQEVVTRTFAINDYQRVSGGSDDIAQVAKLTWGISGTTNSTEILAGRLKKSDVARECIANYDSSDCAMVKS